MPWLTTHWKKSIHDASCALNAIDTVASRKTSPASEQYYSHYRSSFLIVHQCNALDSDVLGHMSSKITCIASTHVFGIGSYKPAAAVDSLKQLAFPASNPHWLVDLSSNVCQESFTRCINIITNKLSNSSAKRRAPHQISGSPRLQCPFASPPFTIRPWVSI